MWMKSGEFAFGNLQILILSPRMKTLVIDLYTYGYLFGAAILIICCITSLVPGIACSLVLCSKDGHILGYVLLIVTFLFLPFSVASIILYIIMRKRLHRQLTQERPSSIIEYYKDDEVLTPDAWSDGHNIMQFYAFDNVPSLIGMSFVGLLLVIATIVCIAMGLKLGFYLLDGAFLFVSATIVFIIYYHTTKKKLHELITLAEEYTPDFTSQVITPDLVLARGEYSV